MENENRNQTTPDDGWFDEMLGKEPTTEELTIDESADNTAVLIPPSDMELEKIIQETKNLPDEEAVLVDDPSQADAQLSSASPEYDIDFAIDEATDTEETDDLSERAETLVKKRRPRMKKGEGLFGIPHILSTAILLLICVTVGVSLGRLLWVCAVDVLAFGKEPMSPKISISQNDSVEDIAAKLKNAGLIEYPGLFVLYMNFSGNDELQHGDHELSEMVYDYHAIKTALEPRATARDVIEVVIPEGYTCQQIFELLQDKGVCSVSELENYAASGDLNDYWFLEGVPRGDKYCLEGYLFPDTYQFYKGHDAELVLEKMLDNFGYRFTDIMKDKIDVLNDRMAETLKSRGYGNDYIESHKFTIREIVIVASMIERETANGSESYDISSVIYNRLTNPGNYPYLNIDATVIYGMGGIKIDPTTGEKLPLTSADLNNDTPYNTYTRKGLIPGPISNPGRNSINAALDPNETPYYFYVYYPSAGHHLFGRNEAEHQQNKDRVGN